MSYASAGAQSGLWFAVGIGSVIVVSALTGLLGSLWYVTLLVGITAFVIWHPMNAFLAFIILTPVHTLAMIVVYSGVSDAGLQMTLFLAWKELILLLTCLMLFVVLGRGAVFLKPTAADRFAAAYVSLALLYVAFPAITGDPSGMSARLYGFRESMLPPIVYLVGRATPSSWDRIHKAAALLVAMAMVWSTVALVEAFVDPGDALRAIGYTEFQVDVLGAGAELNAEGLAYTYTTSSGIRRVGSVFLHPLGFAIALLFVLPLLLTRLLDGVTGYLSASAMALAALFATLSRGPLAAFIFSLGVLFVWRGRVSFRAFAYAGLAAAVVSLPFMTVESLRQYVADTLTAQDGSTLARLADWGGGLLTLADRPILGTGVSAATPGDEVGGAESELLQIALRFGSVGLGLYLLFVGSLARVFWNRRRLTHSDLYVWAGVSLTTLHVYGLINPLWRSGFHTLVVWFAWGLLATRALEDRSSVRQHAPGS